MVFHFHIEIFFHVNILSDFSTPFCLFLLLFNVNFEFTEKKNYVYISQLWHLSSLSSKILFVFSMVATMFDLSHHKKDILVAENNMR